MVYPRRRIGYRRTRRTKRSTLSTRRIFSRTSAKSQASQIYALRRSIRRLSQQTKPETKVWIGGSANFTFTSDAFTNVHRFVNVSPIVQGSGSSQRIGDKINMKAVRFDAYFEYFNNSQTGYLNGESSGGVVRIIALQRKEPAVYTEDKYVSDILAHASASGSDYTIMTASPFKPNITETWKILGDKTFTVTTTRNQKVFHMTVSPGIIRFDTAGNCNYITFLVVTSGLHYDGQASESITGTYAVKCAFTDV